MVSLNFFESPVETNEPSGDVKVIPAKSSNNAFVSNKVSTGLIYSNVNPRLRYNSIHLRNYPWTYFQRKIHGFVLSAIA